MALTPFIPQDRAPEHLERDVVEIMKLDAALHNKIPEPLRRPMVNLLQQVNSFYSNKIEGNPTLPADVLRAQEVPTGEKAGEDLLEIKRHIEAQRRLSNDPIDEVEICTRDSIARLHREFYVGMPEEHMWITVNQETGEKVKLVPGEFRTRGVKVGQHIPPTAENMRAYLNAFERAYRLDWLHSPTNKLLAAAGAHHRLMWIHPFMDGNGRTGRLFTDQYLRAAGLGGYGLWTISRGFGRDVDAYYAALKAADQIRGSDPNDRGELSERGLLTFTEYFIGTALDQVRYFSSLLEPQSLSQRIEFYFEMRSRGAFPSAHKEGLPILRIEAKTAYLELLTKGPMQRGELQAELKMTDHGIRALLLQMANEGLINLDGRKPVSLNLSRHSIEFLFPALF